MGLLPHDDLIEQILQRVPPKSLLRFKILSKQWNSTIESRFFQHQHLDRQKSKNPDLLVIKSDPEVNPETFKNMELEPLTFNNIPIPCGNDYFICQDSIDGLFCSFKENNPVIIFNPTTRWSRILPLSTYQQTEHDITKFNLLGFGKDQITGLYKLVWLYNSLEPGQNMATTTKCEVFDFNINAWRFIEPSSHIIAYSEYPVYLNGSLYWLTKYRPREIRSVLSLDLHKETFEIVCKLPFNGILQNINNGLCIWDNKEDNSCEIWSLNLEEKKWRMTFVIDSERMGSLFNVPYASATPVEIMEERKRKFMLCKLYGSLDDEEPVRLILHDFETRSDRLVAEIDYACVYSYFKSLISIV